MAFKKRKAQKGATLEKALSQVHIGETFVIEKPQKGLSTQMSEILASLGKILKVPKTENQAVCLHEDFVQQYTEEILDRNLGNSEIRTLRRLEIEISDKILKAIEVFKENAKVSSRVTNEVVTDDEKQYREIMPKSVSRITTPLVETFHGNEPEAEVTCATQNPETSEELEENKKAEILFQINKLSSSLADYSQELCAGDQVAIWFGDFEGRGISEDLEIVSLCNDLADSYNAVKNSLRPELLGLSGRQQPIDTWKKYWTAFIPDILLTSDNEVTSSTLVSLLCRMDLKSIERDIKSKTQ